MKEQTDTAKKWILVQAGNCDSDQLETICEKTIEKEKIPLCVAYIPNSSGCKFTVASSTSEVRADEVACYLTEFVGAGGGQSQVAGGFLSECLLLAHGKSTDYEIYFKEKLKAYFSRYQIVRSGEYQADLTQMQRYQKKKTKLGVVLTSDFLKEGTPILVRTLEGDLECVSASDLYIMVGIEGEVYPIRAEKFDHSYEFTDGKPDCFTGGRADCTGDTQPVIHNTITGEAYPLAPYMRTCQAKGITHIFARQLTESAKVFTQWDKYKYLKGEKGDYIAVREDDLSDVYTIEQSIFLRSYERCQ